KAWLDEVKHDAKTREKREESDFLAVANHRGETLDFHGLRHTGGSGLALQGVPPNVIKSVMRHSCITLTMGTYGHLLPDQHSDAVASMAKILTEKTPLAATGTIGAPAVGSAVGARNHATRCDSMRANANDSEKRNTLDFPKKSDNRTEKKGIGP